MKTFHAILQALEALQGVKEGQGVCLTSIGSRGGIGNTLMYHNAVLKYALEHANVVQYLWSPTRVKVSRYSSFSMLFISKTLTNDL
jgi:hypothetical protein